MGYMIVYNCSECDFELVYNTRLFYYDADLRETIDYTFCKATVDWEKKSEIKGEIIETYCSHCNKYVKVYTILKVGSYSKEAYELIKEGINNNVNKKIEELQELIENEERKKSLTSFKIKCWIHRMSVDDLGLDLKIEFLNKKLERCINTVYVIENQRNNLKKANCPNCCNEINLYLNKKMPCPKCGGELIFREADAD